MIIIVYAINVRKEIRNVKKHVFIAKIEKRL